MMIVDFSKGQPPAEVLFQVSGDKANYLAGWLSDKDVRLTGDFLGLGHDRLLIINRDPVGTSDGKMMIMDFSKKYPENKYQENYEAGKPKDIWLDDEDIQLSGDFMGRGSDQVMFIHREAVPDRSSPYFGNEWKLMLYCFSDGKPQIEMPYQENTDRVNYLAGWLSDKDIRLTGDFMGLGHDQLLIINRDPVGATDGKIAVFDFSENSIISKYFELYGNTDPLNEWIDDEDIQLAGDFMDLGHDQMMFISRNPVEDKSSPYLGNNWKLMINDFSKGQPPAEALYQEGSP
jgi:hypothetical protein